MLTITHFIQDTLKAVDKYEGYFDRKKPMNHHRALNVIELRYCLKEEAFDDLEQIIVAVEKILQSMHTGFWFFKTGKSRLKSLIENVITVYQNPLMQIANTTIIELTHSLEKTQLTLDKVSFMTLQLFNNLKSSHELQQEIPLPILCENVNENPCEESHSKGLFKTQHARSTSPFRLISKFFGHSELGQQTEESKTKTDQKLSLN